VDYSNLITVKSSEVVLPQTATSTVDSSPADLSTCLVNRIINQILFNLFLFRFMFTTGDEKKLGYPLLNMLPAVILERGLVKQDYRRAGCYHPIGLIYAPFQVCGFTGGYYCSDDCHSKVGSIIPVRVLLEGKKNSSQIRSWFRPSGRSSWIQSSMRSNAILTSTRSSVISLIY